MSKTAVAAFTLTLLTAIIHQTQARKPQIQAKIRVPRDAVNEYIVKERAWRLSCQRHNCTLHEVCSNQRGWSIWGSDPGCCGNYQGCCKLASVFCWAHDIFCRCCDYGIFVCGPLCTMDPGCPEEEGSGEIHVLNGTDFQDDITNV